MKYVLAFLLLTSITFAEERRSVIYYVGADWCQPCQVMKKTVLYKEGKGTLKQAGFQITKYPITDGHIVIFNVDHDKLPHGLKTPDRIPTMLFIRDGKVRNTLRGIVSAKTISEEYRKLQESTD